MNPFIEKGVHDLERVRQQISRVIVGQEQVVWEVIIALLCEGHVLLEGVPGLGKTLLVRSLADSLSLSFARIQFTPDLMPADILGATMVLQNDSGRFDLQFEKGPVFANLVLADEINRASPKTQSALLEAMQERSVTIRGVGHGLPRPFLVLATQNPLEMEGTYPLPEAQVDRFLFKIIVNSPKEEELVTILERTIGPDIATCQPVLGSEELTALQRAVRDVVIPPHVLSYAARLTMATQPEGERTLPSVKKYIRYGAGPRGAQALTLASKAKALADGRFSVSLEDIHSVYLPSMRHRVVLNFDGLSEGICIETMLQEIIESLPVEKTKQWSVMGNIADPGIPDGA